jgi:hypothetical protein
MHGLNVASGCPERSSLRSPQPPFGSQGSLLRNSPARAQPVEAFHSRRPFSRQQRAYPLRHSHGRVADPGLSLRGNVPFSPKPLTLSSPPHWLLLTAGNINTQDPRSDLPETLATAHRPFAPLPGLSTRPARSARSGSPPRGLPFGSARFSFAPRCRLDY